MKCSAEIDPSQTRFVELWADPGDVSFVAYSREYDFRTTLEVSSDEVLELVLPKLPPRFDVTFVQQTHKLAPESAPRDWMFWQPKGTGFVREWFAAGEERKVEQAFPPGEWIGSPDSLGVCGPMPGDPINVTFTVQPGAPTRVELPALIPLALADHHRRGRYRKRVQARLPLPEDVTEGLRSGRLWVSASIECVFVSDFQQRQSFARGRNEIHSANLLLAEGALLVMNVPFEREVQVSITLEDYEFEDGPSNVRRIPKKASTRERRCSFTMTGHDRAPLQIEAAWSNRD